MISPARMVRIWEKEPGLRPDRVWYVGNLWHVTGVGKGIAADEIAEALIRDKCVWWLLRRSNLTVIFETVDRGHTKVGGKGFDITDAASTSLCDPIDDETECVLQVVERVLGLPAWEEPK